MGHRTLARATVAAALLAAPAAHAGGGVTTLDLAPFAALDVSRFHASSFGFSELDRGPGAVRDGDPATAWDVPGDEGQEAALVFDWTGPNAIEPFGVSSIHVVVTPPEAAIGVRVGRSQGALADAKVDVSRDASGTTLTLRGAPPLRVLELRFPAGAAVANVRVLGGPVNGKLGMPINATCDDQGVHMVLDGTGILGVVAVRSGATGGLVRIDQRVAAPAVFSDATVRFDARPATYSYVMNGVGSADPPTKISVTCEGPALLRPPAGPLHGVIEGFYGRPWTWYERAKVVASMGALGMDTYVYAPKDDPLHRDRWRELYDAATMDRFYELREQGRGAGVNVVYAISPGLDIDPASPDDVAALVDKVASMASGAGIRDAALLLDDIGGARDGAVGAAHAALASALLASMKARDPESRLLFVPTVYAGLAGDLPQGDLDYLASLSAVPAEVPIAWTGPAVFSASIDIADLSAFAALFGRGPEGVWVWDNYPVNDIALVRRLYTAPIVGRDSLLPASGGVVANPMRHALASIPALASYAEMALDPVKYAADRAVGARLASADLALALADAVGPRRALATFFDELVHHDTIWPDVFASSALTNALDAYANGAAPGAARRAAALALATHLARLAITDVELRRDLDDTALADEIDAQARACSVSARAALEGMGAARAGLLGDAAEEASAAARSACLWLSADQPSWRNIQDAVKSLIPAGDTSACPTGDPFVGPAPQKAMLGQPWSFDAGDRLKEQGAAFALVGPAGATVSKAGQVAWTPSRLGRFRMVAIAAGDAGTSAAVFDVVVDEAPESSPSDVPEEGCSCRVERAGDAGRGSSVLLFSAAVLLLTRRRARGWGPLAYARGSEVSARRVFSTS